MLFCEANNGFSVAIFLKTLKEKFQNDVCSQQKMVIMSGYCSLRLETQSVPIRYVVDLWPLGNFVLS